MSIWATIWTGRAYATDYAPESETAEVDLARSPNGCVRLGIDPGQPGMCSDVMLTPQQARALAQALKAWADEWDGQHDNA
jgi:hypothetical protein